MTVQAHSVARLLTDEMRARVRAARFEPAPCPMHLTEVGRQRCPLGVAFDIDGMPDSDIIAKHAGWKRDGNEARLVIQFFDALHKLDSGSVYALLGCTDPDDDASRPPAAGGV